MSTQTEELSCQELVELVTNYVDGILSPAERASFDHHLEGCTGCREYVEQMRSTIEVTGRLTPADVSPEMEEKLLTVFRNWKSV